MLGLGFALTNFGTKGGVVDTPDLSGSSAAALLAAYGGEGFSMIFDSAAPSLKITDSTTPSNDWDSDLGDGYSVQDFFKTRSFTSYTGPVSTGKRLMQADGYIKPCRHNLLPMSNRFGSAAWTRTAATSTYGQTDVDGGATASLITESNTSTSVLYNATAFTTAANVPYTISCKIKKGNSTWVRLAFGTSGGTFTNGVQQWYNLDTVATGTAATTGTASYISSSITATTNSYYILTLTASQASTTGAFIVSTATADASATRTTSGTYYICHAMCNSGSSVLDYVSSEAHNLVIQSRTLGTSWTATDITVGNDAATSPDGTTSAESLTEGVAGTALLRSTAFTVPASSTVTASFYFKTSTATWVRFTLADGSDTNGVRQWFNLATGAKGTLTAIGSGTATSSAITACANGWYRCEITGVCSTSTSLTMSVSSASADASNTRVNSVVYYADCAQAELATSAGKVTTTTTTSVYNQHFDIPVEYNSDGTVKALTREEARTNLALYSIDMSQSQTVSAGLSALAKTQTGLEGATSAVPLTEDTSTGLHRTISSSAYTLTAATKYTYTLYAKAGSGSRNLYINAVALMAAGANYTLSGSGTVNSTTGAAVDLAASIEAIGSSGWYKLTLVGTGTASSNRIYQHINSNTASADNSYTGDGSSGFILWAHQLETGTGSSLIATGSAAVTRAADHIYWATTIAPFSTSEVTLYGKELILNTPSSTDTICALNANGSYGAGDGLLMRITSLISSQVGGNSSSVAKAISPAATVGGTVKVAGGAKVSTTTQAVTNSGQAVATDATCDWTGTSNRVVIGNIQSGSQPGRQGLVEFMLLPTYDTTVMQNVTA